ncbi:hypothetical protein [Bacillus pseudomycoides]|uniref:Uncharacterized protein n=1 Tax=Bacillus pseudomycoides TaxID=64104 RepID=A0A2B5RQA4_9BACI|nr:hypothetical protein [Bacillus pseudomycoides]PED72999.1 hypothetical protein CON97_06685 [Bacillus pseudomycoides]PEI45052.1 hypothetical protein CN620_03005 [Bacillus pseudomycoides]PEJ79518.1 hypothetical protein CN680_09245 [Bacillus pseudomycoides]PEM20029.1 hypothetical protein CN628_04500 [Bacillus pseudomycoides]PEM69786.1 hypothetical protein CN613_10290 [Bacillus pseudomycoides]
MQVTINLDKHPEDIQRQLKLIVYSITYGKQSPKILCETSGIYRQSFYNLIQGKTSTRKAQELLDRIIPHVPFSHDEEIIQLAVNIYDLSHEIASKVGESE